MWEVGNGTNWFRVQSLDTTEAWAYEGTEWIRWIARGEVLHGFE